MKNYAILVLLFITNIVYGQIELVELSNKILKNDSLVFEESFNKCNFDLIDELISSDFEFYHDQHGITSGKDNFINIMKQNICALPYRPRRELVKGSSSVYPLRANNIIYGAIQMGKHNFYAKEEGKEEYFTSVADFTHLWILEDDVFKLKRVLSYNHLTSDMRTPH